MKNRIESERANLFEPNVYIHLFVQILGKPPLDDLVNAVQIAFTKNEATMSKIVLEQDGTAYYEKMKESGCKISIARDNWQNIIEKNEKIPFHINQGELMRVFVISTDEKVSLLIIAHHLVGDGKSIVYFLEDVMKSLSGEEREYKSLRLLTKEYFPPKTDLSLYLKSYVNKFNKKWRKNGMIFTWENYYDIHETYWKERSSKIIYKTFSLEETNQIRLQAKEIGITVNSYIITAFLRADKKKRFAGVGIPVDIRQDHNRSMSNQTGGIRVDHIYSDKRAFAENARQVHDKVQNKLKHQEKKYFVLRLISLFIPTLIDSVLLHTYGLYQNKTTQKLAGVLGYTKHKMNYFGISNLARLDIPDAYGSYGISDIIFIPPAISYSKHTIGISTMRDEMIISCHVMDNHDKVKEQEFFLRSIHNLIDINENL